MLPCVTVQVSRCFFEQVLTYRVLHRAKLKYGQDVQQVLHSTSESWLLSDKTHHTVAIINITLVGVSQSSCESISKHSLFIALSAFGSLILLVSPSPCTYEHLTTVVVAVQSTPACYSAMLWSSAHMATFVGRVMLAFIVQEQSKRTRSLCSLSPSLFFHCVYNVYLWFRFFCPIQD